MMAEPQTTEEHAARLYKLICYGLGYGMSHSRGRERILEYLNNHFHLAGECQGPECCQDEIPTHVIVP